MRICISIGEYTSNPYYVPGLEVPAFCIEELCVLLTENAVLLDETLLNRSLVDWIRLECCLPELADALTPLVQKSGTVSTLVGMILEYVGLYSPEEIGECHKVLLSGAGLSSIEKHKRQIDRLCTEKKYRQAVRGYQSLVRKWEDVKSDDAAKLPAGEVLASIHHNMGVAYAGMMKYHLAAEAFLRAEQICPEEREHSMAYLAAKRMELSDEEYVALAADHLDQFRNSLVLEKTMDALNKAWKVSPEAKRLEERGSVHDTLSECYFEENGRIMAGLMASYRESVGE
jgi:tetratricopeptide (TPR) repeat protein